MAALVAVPIGIQQVTPDSDDVVYVDAAAAPDGGDGSANDPFGSLQRAVNAAPNGATIQLAPGTYHEAVQVYRKEVHIVGEEGVVLDGAAPLDGWTADSDDYSVAWTPFERVGAPFVVDAKPEAGWPEQVFVDGEELTEVTSRDAVADDSFFVDTDARKLIIGVDPASHNVEVSQLGYGLYLNKADKSSVSDITVKRYATPRSNMAAIRAYSNNVTLTGLTVEDNSHIGISAIGHDVTVSSSTIQRSGYIGVHGHRADRLVVEKNAIVDNNFDGYNSYHAAAGMKVTTSLNIRVDSNVVTGNDSPGLWTDLQVRDSDFINNVVTDNGRSGIEIELSLGIVVAGNTVTHNQQRGVWILESSDADVWNNVIVENGRELWVEDGPRADIVGVRFHNNIMGGVAGAQAIMLVDDWTAARSTVDMQVSGDHNAYWAPKGAPRYLSRLAEWPDPLLLSTTLAEHQQNSGFDANSLSSHEDEDPFLNLNEAGTPLSPRVAEALGFEAGKEVGIGTNFEVAESVYVPQDLSVEAGDDSLTATWSRPVGGTAPAEYVLWVNGEEVATVEDTTATVDAEAGTRYVQVQAVAADGRRSVRSVPEQAEVGSGTPSTTVSPREVPDTTTTTVPETTTTVTTVPETTTTTTTVPETTTTTTTEPDTTTTTTEPDSTVTPTTVTPAPTATRVYTPSRLLVGDIGVLVAAWDPPTGGATPAEYAIWVNNAEVARVAGTTARLDVGANSVAYVQIQAIAADGTRGAKTAPVKFPED